MKLSKRNSPGFTMIEVVVALVILAIISTLAIAHISSVMNEANVTSEADVIKGHLRYAQAQSMNNTVNWGIVFSSTSYQLFIYNPATSTTTYPQVPGATTATSIVSFVGPLSGMTITTGTVSFDSWGTPYTDGTASTLQTGGTRSLTLSLGGNSATISIQDDTGLIQ
jgi:prepilin-type N-terminal cleavage/methylation domain-containing protein